eukprot:8375745-Pyramimonas_sp.AAC.1
MTFSAYSGGIIRLARVLMRLPHGRLWPKARELARVSCARGSFTNVRMRYETPAAHLSSHPPARWLNAAIPEPFERERCPGNREHARACRA